MKLSSTSLSPIVGTVIVRVLPVPSTAAVIPSSGPPVIHMAADTVHSQPSGSVPSESVSVSPDSTV